MNALAHLSARDRRALLLLVPAVIAILLMRFAILPALDTAGVAARPLAIREKTLGKYRAIVAAVPLHESNAGMLAGALAESEKGLLTGATPALQDDELQQQVRDLAGGAGIQLRAVSFTPPRNAGEDYVQLGLTTQFTAGVDQLVAFLTTLQSAPRILSVDQLRVTAANVPPAPNAAGKKQVNVSIAIWGVALAKSPEKN